MFTNRFLVTGVGAKFIHETRASRHGFDRRLSVKQEIASLILNKNINESNRKFRQRCVDLAKNIRLEKV
jgi:hypothetical protein